MTDLQRDMEIWKPISGYEGRYEVSDLGRIRSAPTLRSRGGILRPDTTGGYLRVQLWRGGKYVRPLVHRLVLEAFVGPCPDGMEACHGSPDKSDNRIGNLRWDTHKNNHADKLAHGTHLRGEAIGNSKLKASDVFLIRSLRQEGKTLLSIARQLGVSQSLVHHITKGRVWRHV